MKLLIQLEKAKSARTVPKTITVTRDGKTYQTVTYVIANPDKGKEPAANLGFDFGEDFRRQLAVTEEERLHERRRKDEARLAAYWAGLKRPTDEERAEGLRLDMAALRQKYSNEISDLQELAYKGPEPVAPEPEAPAETVSPFTRKGRLWAGKIADFWASVPPNVTSIRELTPEQQSARERLSLDLAAAGLKGFALSLAGMGSAERMVAFYRKVAAGELGYTFDNGKVVKSRYEDMPMPQKLRHYFDMERRSLESFWFLGYVIGSDGESLSSDNLYFNGQHETPLWEGKSGTVNIGRKKYIVPPRDTGTSLIREHSDPVEAVRAMVAKGVKTVDDCIAVGEIIYAEVMRDTPAAVAEIKAMNDQIIELEAKEAKARVIVQKAAPPRYRESPETNAIDPWIEIPLEERRAMSPDWVEKSRKHAEIVKEANALIKKRDDEQGRLHASGFVPKENGKAAVDFLSKIRPMGPNGTDTMAKLMVNANAEQVTMATEAISVIPADWIRAVRLPVRIKHSTDQGWWKGGQRLIVANWRSGGVGRALNTRAHELGHMVEDSNPEVRELCKAFVASLSTDRMKSQKGAMRNWQKGVQSEHLPSQYCGVLYDHGSTEVLSMAAGDLFNDHARRMYAGKRCWQFVLGMMAGVRGGE